ncbi:MAG TPA: winged helix-turn-helix domain-containing protein [Thermoanaerobaculia bacterium]|nr:winged helix-turn-helix domain-containing protein [Thermoanaerobaculia bacterium]
MRSTGQKLFRFRGCTFDAVTGELSRPGRDPVVLPVRLAAVLATLLENGGEMVSREDLYRAVWGDHIVDHEHGLNFCIRQLRLQLGDDASAPVFIETIRGRGYRFLAHLDDGGHPAMGPAMRRRRFMTAILIAGTISLWSLSGWTERAGGVHPSDLEVSQLVQEARYLEGRGSAADLQRAIHRYRTAIAARSESAAALTGLARSHSKLAMTNAVPRVEAFSSSRDAALAALRRDGNSSDAQLVLGIATLYLELDWKRAENHFRRAAASKDGSADARLWYARALAARGDFAAALREARLSFALQPESSEILGEMAWFHYFAADYESAILTAGRALDLEPALWGALQCLQLSHIALGQAESARAVTERILRSLAMETHAAPPPSVDAGDGWLQRAARQINDACPTESLSVESARLYALAGDHDSAIPLLRKGLSERTFWSPFVSIDPAFRELRRQRSFENLLAEIASRART